MTRADGTSRITETIFENLQCTCRNWRASAPAHPSRWRDRRPWKAVAGQGRAGDGDRPARLGIAGDRGALAPPRAEAMVNRVYHLDRGFERLEDKLNACGAQISRISG